MYYRHRNSPAKDSKALDPWGIGKAGFHMGQTWKGKLPSGVQYECLRMMGQCVQRIETIASSSRYYSLILLLKDISYPEW